MAKIIILGSGKDADAAKGALDAASIECDIVEPTAANLLHIVIGMVDDGEEEEPKDESAAEPTEEPAPEEEVPAEEPIEEPVEESLGMINIDGEDVKAFKSTSKISAVYVQNLSIGSRTSYSINESEYGIWPADLADIVRGVSLTLREQHKTLVLPIMASKRNEAYFSVGEDLIDFFKV